MGNNTTPRIKFNCDFCGNQSDDKASAYKKKKRHFCNTICYSNFRRYDLPFEEQHRYGTGHSAEERAKRRKARSDTNHAVRDGVLERKPCEIADCVNWPEAHHDDYNKPLEVRWLCFIHHRQWHKRIYENPELL